MKISKITLTTFFAATALLSFNVNAVPETESNNTKSTAQSLPYPNQHAIKGVLGIIGERSHNDVDYFSFYAKAGEVLNFDIDNGYGGIGNTNTIIGIFDPSGRLIRMNDNAESIDSGSISLADSRIDAFVAPVTGSYFVGVSAYPRFFSLDGREDRTTSSNILTVPGDYTLNIINHRNVVQKIAIEIKPGTEELSPLNPRSNGKIPVAIYGSSTFNVANIDKSSLRFGSSGKEDSLANCQKSPKDLNRDGYADKLCHFQNSDAAFKSGDIEGTLTGKLYDGTEFSGRSLIKVVPSRRK